MANYKYECFAFRSTRQDCACLTQLLCNNPDPNYVCPFFKNKADVDAKKMAADIKEYALTHGGHNDHKGRKQKK